MVGWAVLPDDFGSKPLQDDPDLPTKVKLDAFYFGKQEELFVKCSMQ
jgi:hypothetical protein